MSAECWRLTVREERFPACVRELGDRTPPALHGLGDVGLVAEIDPDRTVTIVGSRRSGSYGKGVAFELGHGAAAAGLVVVSGMALGCDSAAHEGALAAGGPTIAVLGNGPDLPYPASKSDLYRRILAGAGAVVAEQEPGTHPAPQHFPARNRIMAALAGFVLIVEGADPSGTRHTAEEATGLGREVGAVPGAVTSALAALPNQLIREGAAMVRDPQDLLDLMLGAGCVSVRSVGPALEDSLRPALAAVESGAGSGDAVALETGQEGREVAVALARLELMGYLRSDAVGRFTRTTLREPSGE